MIKEQKLGINYIVWEKKKDSSIVCADIIRFSDYFCGRERIRYRVDFKGRTIFSLLNLTEARSRARKLVKEN